MTGTDVVEEILCWLDTPICPCTCNEEKVRREVGEQNRKNTEEYENDDNDNVYL